MSKKNIKKVMDAGFIPGIYNYCDRWCERCELKINCMSFEMESKIEEKGLLEKKVSEVDKTWGALFEVFESTLGVLQEIAREHNLDVEDICEAENIRPQLWSEMVGDELEDELEEQMSSSELIKMCLIYEHLSEECLDYVFETFDELEEETGDKRGRTLVVTEAIEVLTRYVDLIRIKLLTALQNDCSEIESNEKEQRKLYADGAAKMALLGVERMIKSWMLLKHECPKLDKEIGKQILILNQLRIDIESRFPSARTFLRPGFEC